MLKTNTFSPGTIALITACNGQVVQTTPCVAIL